MKELELEEWRMKRTESMKATKIKHSILLVTVGVLLMIAGGFFGAASGPNSAFWIVMIIGFSLLIGAIMIWSGGNK